MRITVPSHIVLATVPNGWPDIPQYVIATGDDDVDLPPERVWEVLDDGNRVELAGLPARYYRVDDNLMIWTRLGKFPANSQASYVVFAQASRRDPTRTRLNRFLRALKALAVIAKDWRILEESGVWRSAELDADAGPRANRVRSEWPGTWYPITGYTGTPPGLVPVYDTTHPIVGCIYAL